MPQPEQFSPYQRLIGLGLKEDKSIVGDDGKVLHCFSDEKIQKHLEFMAQPRHYRIWSIEHRAWWKPARDDYTPDATKAGLYTLEEAEQICADANTHCMCEVMVPAFCAVHPELPKR